MARTIACGLACFLILCFSNCAIYAAEYEVKEDGTGDFTTIQDAIDAANDGDVIVVHPGTYYENIHFDGKNITLRSPDPDKKETVASTVIDGGRKGSVVTFSGAEKEKCLLSGFTITNGSTGLDGGGICGAGTSAAISSCVVTGNSATGAGGAGGGLACCDGTISRCTITDNAATGEYGPGGGLWNCDGPIGDCTITENSAVYGAGLSDCDGPISNCTITDNSADCAGGGLAESGGAIRNCTISDNSAWEHGGGLSGCSGTIRNCTISGNSAWEQGGGLYYCCGGAISNCTISGNSARSCGGGLIYCYGTISNCVVWGNEAPEGAELSDCARITYSCIRGWTGGGEGNVGGDPLFVSGPLGDYYLSCRAAGQAADSPCIDAGSGTAESLGLDKFTTRTDSVPDAATIDMGYHYPPALDQNPQIECSLNTSEFAPGDVLVGLIEAQNPGADVAVDAYVAFILPDGAPVSLTAGGLVIGIRPWVYNVGLPSGFHFGPCEVLRITVPQAPGSYLFAAALANPGELVFIGDPSLFPLTLRE